MRDKAAIQEKMQTLIKMTAEFCDANLDEEYKQLCEKLIRKMARKRDVPFLYGRIEIWAAAVVYAVGTLNLLFDKTFEPYLAPDDICTYFSTNLRTTYEKSKRIRDMFKMKYMDAEFSTQYIIEKNPRAHLMIGEEYAPIIKRLIKNFQKAAQKNKKIFQKNGNKKKDDSRLREQSKLSDFIEVDGNENKV